MKNKFLFFIGVILLLQACASPIYYAKRTHGQIVEHETGKPIEGVIVVAEWVLFHKGGHSTHKSNIRIVEAITDKNGNYVIPCSPIVRLKPFTELTDRDPAISFFKKGYRPLFVQNSSDRDTVIRYSEWNGRVLKLKHLNYSNDRYAHSLSVLFNYAKSDWCFVPKLLQAVYDETQKLRSAGVDFMLLPDVPDTIPDPNEFACF